MKPLRFTSILLICIFSIMIRHINAASVTEEEYQQFLSTQSPEIQQLVKDSDNLRAIPKEEIFSKGKSQITWDEFKNLPRRQLDEAEVAGLQRAAANGNPTLLLGDLFGFPKGYNNFDYSNALWGDVLLVFDGLVPWGYFRHVGTFDRDRFNQGLPPILDADPQAGVGYSPISKFLHYDQQVGLKPLIPYGWVAYNALQTAKQYFGLPYSYLFEIKANVLAFYCSSLIWRGYYNQGWDIDSDGGGFVSPDDIYNSPYLWVWQNAQ